MSNTIIHKFKQDIEKASNDPHDIEGAYESIFDKYINQYPGLTSAFQNIFDQMSEEVERSLS